MTVTTPEREVLATLERPAADVSPPGPSDESGETPVSVQLTCVAIFLSMAAAGWMTASVFRGMFPKVVALVGALLGVATVALSYRTRRPSIVQYLALPAAIGVGTLLVLPDASGGTANLPGLVSEALRTGGVAQPPIAFDPGWRFLLVVLLAVLGAAAASLATGLNRPRVGIFLPVPLLFGASLLQPEEGSLIGIGVSLVLFLGSLAVSYGVELAREGATSGRFELRRLLRGAATLVILVAALAGLSRLGFLFPDTERDQVVPPQKPEVQPPQEDRELFRVRSARVMPWRLGVLDVFDGRAWLLPPFDTKRFVDIASDGRVPRRQRPQSEPRAARAFSETAPPPAAPSGLRAEFTISDIEGHVIPTIAGASTVRTREFAVQFDPRTQMLRLPDTRASRGMAYSVVADAPPTGRDLNTAPVPGPELSEFLRAPPAPSDVVRLLDEAPRTPLWERLQFVRNRFYQHVVAAGAGDPVDTPPSRVTDMLAGGEGTPYEITAAEALLARWAGIPSRIGYGFYGGDTKPASAGVRSIHPSHGSTWLEAYFEGHGWIPVIGVPPRAKASLSQQRKNQDPNVRPSKELALIVYVPIKLESIQLLFVSVRYWVAVIGPIVLGGVIAFALFPGPIKTVRRFLRRRRAHAGGIRMRIATAYAEFRDAANDLNVGDAVATPLEFRASIEQDDEHDELAWLVTRALWADLDRDLRPDDADAAEELAPSVTRRLRRAQSATTRMLALGSRASLRDPYDTELMNLWRSPRRRSSRKGRPFRRLRRILPFTGALLLVLLSGCAQDLSPHNARSSADALPKRLVPPRLERFAVQPEREVESAFRKAGREALVDRGHVFTIREGKEVQAYLEVAAFRRGFGAERAEVREGVLQGIGAGRFEPTRVGRDRVYVMKVAEQHFYLWFPPDGRYFELLVARPDFEEAEAVLAALLSYQRGERAELRTERERPGLLDPRRGADL